MNLDFNNKVIWKLSENVWITESIISTWIIMAFLIAIAVVVRIKLKKFTDVPTGAFQNVVELAVESMDSFVTSTMGKDYAYFGNWFFGVFAFIIISNYSGLFGLRPPTTDLATTACLAIVTFTLIHFMGIKTKKAAYFKEYFEPYPFFLPINLIGALATPISLCFRLFGNILGGFIIMGMVYSLFPIFLKIGIPASLHLYFDIFAGALQAYIFTILSMTFIREKIPD